MEYRESNSENFTLNDLNKTYVKIITNILIEAPFFYMKDDPDLFSYLRSHQENFKAFFEHYFGWELYVDRQVARLIKPTFHNQVLKPGQKDFFDLTRRDECTVFMMLIEYYEKIMRDLNISYDDDKHIRFLLADFVTYCIQRAIEELGENNKIEKAILDGCRTLFPKLIKYRFIEQIDKVEADKNEELPGDMHEHIMFEFLPGIHCYRPDILIFKEVIKLFSNDKTEMDELDENNDFNNDTDTEI